LNTFYYSPLTVRPTKLQLEIPRALREFSKFNEVPINYLLVNPDFYFQVKLVAEGLDSMINSMDYASIYVLIGKTGQSNKSGFEVGSLEFYVKIGLKSYSLTYLLTYVKYSPRLVN